MTESPVTSSSNPTDAGTAESAHPADTDGTEAAVTTSADESVDGEGVEASSTTSHSPADAAAADVEAGGSAPSDLDVSGRGGRVKALEAEGDIAADYLEELLDIADLDGDLDMDVEGDRAAVSIVGNGLDALVGDDGEVLDALQELTRLAVYRETGERSRLMLDIGDFRVDLRRSLVELAQDAIVEVKDSGDAVKLAPMSPFERKVIHDAVAEAGLTSASEGEEPTRCVVIAPSA